MCKPGQPCPEAKTDRATNNVGELMSRLEGIIVAAEMHEAHDVDVPRAAIVMLDIIGPMLLDSVKKAKGWSEMKMALEAMKQRNSIFEKNGMKVPAHPLHDLLQMLTEAGVEVDVQVLDLSKSKR